MASAPIAQQGLLCCSSRRYSRPGLIRLVHPRAHRQAAPRGPRHSHIRDLQLQARRVPCYASEKRTLAEENYQSLNIDGKALEDFRSLEHGARNHTLSIYVADESGMINRVTGVFARRGFNIESLAVGLNEDRALFTAVVAGTDNVVTKLCKQVYKLINVRRVEDQTYVENVERELVLIKIRVEDKDARQHILQVMQQFRGRVVDVAEEILTLEFTGDPGKIIAVQTTLNQFGIVQVARTGRIALERGSEHARQKILEDEEEDEELHHMPEGSDGGSRSDLDTETLRAAMAEVGAVDMIKQDEEHTDVYGDSVLQPVTLEDIAQGGKGANVLHMVVNNAPGVLNRVTGVLARRGYSIQSLAVGPGETLGVSRITVVVPGTTNNIAKLLEQVRKLVSVREAEDLTHIPYISRELMLIKVNCRPKKRAEIIALLGVFRAGVVDVSTTSMTIEVTGTLKKLAGIQRLLGEYGILEVARTGLVALKRESGVDSKLLAQCQFVGTPGVWDQKESYENF